MCVPVCVPQFLRLVQVVENAVRAVGHLRGLGCKDIEFSPEDAGRSDPKFLYRVLAAVIQAGATTVNIPDTTGVQALAAPQAWTSRQTLLMLQSRPVPSSGPHAVQAGTCRTSLEASLQTCGLTHLAQTMLSSPPTARCLRLVY